MSDIKIYGKLKSGVTTKALVDATEVAGGFMSLTTDEMNSLSDALKVEGMLVYCTSDSKFYQLKQGKWVVALEQEQKTIGEVVTNVTVNPYGSFYITSTNIETKEQTTMEAYLFDANGNSSGLMSSDNYQMLQNLDTNYGNYMALTKPRLFYTDKSNPTAKEITAFASFASQSIGVQSEDIIVVVRDTFRVWRNINGVWVDVGVDAADTFTNDTAGIVKGSTDNGKINAESDGTGSVNGWSDLTQRVSNVESQATVQNLIGEINLTNEGTTVEKQDNSLLVKSTCKINNHDNTISTPVTAQFNVPIRAGSNITFTEATDKSAVVISATASSSGVDINGTGENSIKLSITGGEASGANSIAIGNSTKATQYGTIAIGAQSEATNSSAVAVGQQSTAGHSGVAIGAVSDGNSDGYYGVAVGAYTTVEKDYGVAIGANNIISTDTQHVIIGANSLNEETAIFQVGCGTGGAQLVRDNCFKVDSSYNAYAGSGATKRLAFADELGDSVTANPQQDTTTQLYKIQIGNSIFSITNYTDTKVTEALGTIETALDQLDMGTGV